jgi:pullulanase/glycogen debranching enzyme
MHVDGFRFDLATALGRTDQGAYEPNAAFFEILKQDPVLRSEGHHWVLELCTADDAAHDTPVTGPTFEVTGRSTAVERAGTG